MTTTVPKRFPPGTPLRDRLLGRAIINQATGCWEWAGGKTTDGYAKVGIDGRTREAHRPTYELWNGPIAGDLVLDHLCRVRHCINPAHLEPVTQRENLLRSPFVGSDTHCKRGHEWTEANTYVYRGSRCCRTCNADSHRKNYTRLADRQEVAA